MLVWLHPHLTMFYQWSHIWRSFQHMQTWKYIGACVANYISNFHLFLFFRWPLQLSPNTFLIFNAFSLTPSLTFCLPSALPISFNFFLPIALATIKAYSLALPTFLGVACELWKDLILLLWDPISSSTTTSSSSTSPSSKLTSRHPSLKLPHSVQCPFRMSPHGHIMFLLLDLNKCFDVCFFAVISPIPPFNPIMNMPKKIKTRKQWN